MTRLAVVGGGIAGLAVAEAVRRRSRAVEIVVLERASRAGGNIRSEAVDGYTCEWGPNGFLDSVPETLELVRAIGLADRLQESDAAARRRFIYRNGRLHALPGSPLDFLRSPLLSWPGKGRLLLEPLTARSPGGDESIHDFAVRHLGPEAAEVLVGPMVSVVFAADATRLSLRACFPRMWTLEAEHRSLFLALLAVGRRRRRERAAGAPGTARPAGSGIGAPAGHLTSFRGGMEDLVRALVDVLDDAVCLNSHVSSIEEPAAGSARGAPAGRFLLRVAGQDPVSADGVVLAGPAHESAAIVRSLDAELAEALTGVPTAPIAVVCLGYDAAGLSTSGVDLNGFGFLVPPRQGVRILGAVWDSSVYPGRAPAGKALVRVMIGGARDPGAVDLADDELVGTVRQDLARTMTIHARPEFVRMVRHRVGIPQYVQGHRDRLDRIEARLRPHAGLFLAGNSYRGVSVNNCVADAAALVDRILEFLERPDGRG